MSDEAEPQEPDESEPTPGRQAELRTAYELHVAAGHAPHAGIVNRTRGALSWVVPAHISRMAQSSQPRPLAGAKLRLRPRRLPLALAALVGLLLLACGAVPYYLTMAPANTLVLDVGIRGQWGYSDAGLTHVELHIGITDRTHGSIAFQGNQSFVCAGVIHPETTASSPVLDIGSSNVPRQPPGGAYVCVYTDERGHRTTLSVPVPLGRLAMVSPAPFDKVPAPNTSAPAPLFIHYTVPTLPAGAVSKATGEALCAGCFTVIGTWQPLTGTYEFFGPGTPGTGDSAILSPQSGQIIMSTSIVWPLTGSGFSAVRVTYEDTFYVRVTWVPAP